MIDKFDSITLGIEIDKTQRLKTFIIDTVERMKYNSFVSDFKINLISSNKKHMIVIYMMPIIKVISISIIITFFSTVLFFTFRWTFLLILPLVMASISFFQSAPTIYLLLRLGLKKTGYKGKFKRLSKDEIIRRLLEHGTN